MRQLAAITADYRACFGAEAPESIRRAEDEMGLGYTLDNLGRIFDNIALTHCFCYRK